MEETSLSQEKQTLDNNNVLEQKATSKVWDAKVILNFVITGIFIIIGFYKIFAYSYEEYGDNNVNAYVGGDAYNYIINANYATAYFVLALIFTIIGCTLLICNIIQRKGS
ncbi:MULTISPECIES: hypothetical protein [Bacillaceae]|uniref:hypothetical protein n=1 Tax=Bacillaceae TaxID=186817 RepID=UPI001C2E27D5|nr:hypothetical protein [Cytobacillus firmus]